MKNIEELHNELVMHPSYRSITDIDSLRVFMNFHIFAVWDFMSLLKRLQTDLTCVAIPWRPSPYPDEMVRLINEIVLGEESDIDLNGEIKSHFKMYLEAMKEVGADSNHFLQWLDNPAQTPVHPAIKNFVGYHIDLAMNGQIHQVAGAFFWGREKLLPDVFTSIVRVIEKSQLSCPNLIYYFKRHIELDGDHHGPMSLKCLNLLCGNDEKLHREARQAAIKSLELRSALWDAVLSQMPKDSLLAVNP